MTAPLQTNYGKRLISIASLNSSGTGESRIQNNNSGTLWIVRQISVITSPTASGTTCTLTLPAGIVDTSYFAGTGDVAGGDPPIYLHAGDFIGLVWSQGPSGGQGIATAFYDEIIGV